jgi:hypothetical protein
MMWITCEGGGTEAIRAVWKKQTSLVESAASSDDTDVRQALHLT